MKTVYSVGQVNRYVKNMFIQDYVLRKVYVKGEVSNCKYHTSGHIYFSLKDETGVLSCVMFAGQRRGLAFRMKAGAVLLKAAEGKSYRPAAHSDGKGGSALTGPGAAGRIRSIDRDCKEAKTEYITMNGKDVFQFAVRNVPKVIQEVLKENELSIEDIDWFVLHQANARIVDAVARRLRLDIGKFPMNLQDYGNTSSASIPILLNELNRKGILRKGQKLVLAGFGAGLSWGASVLEWGIDSHTK